MNFNKTNIEIILGDAKTQKMSSIISDIEAPSEKDESVVRLTCAKALTEAIKTNKKSLIFPALGYKSGFPLVGSAKVMAQEIYRQLKSGDVSLDEIIICLDDEEARKIFDQQLTGYIHHLQNDLGEEPYKTVDIIIELDEGIILIERSNPPYGWALPGGFLDSGEDLKEAAIRETKEETNLDLDNVREFAKYGEPGRDPRFHTITTVFIGKGVGQPQFGDDARNLKIVKYDDLLKHDYAFDHKQVVEDYLNQRN